MSSQVYMLKIKPVIAKSPIIAHPNNYHLPVSRELLVLEQKGRQFRTHQHVYMLLTHKIIYWPPCGEIWN